MSLLNIAPAALQGPDPDPMAPASDMDVLKAPTASWQAWPEEKPAGKASSSASWQDWPEEGQPSTPKGPVNPMTGEGGTFDTGLGNLMGAKGPTSRMAETAAQGSASIKERAEQVGGARAGTEALVGAVMTIPGLIPQVISLFERGGRYGYAKLLGMHKDNPEALREYVKDAGFSEALSEALRGLIGFNKDNQGAYVGGQELLAAPFSGALDWVGEEMGPGAELAAEAGMMVAPFARGRKPAAPKPDVPAGPPPQSFYDNFQGPQPAFVGPEMPNKPPFEMAGPPRDPFVGPEPRPGHGLPEQGELFGPDPRLQTDMGPPRAIWDTEQPRPRTGDQFEMFDQNPQGFPKAPTPDVIPTTPDLTPVSSLQPERWAERKHQTAQANREIKELLNLVERDKNADAAYAKLAEEQKVTKDADTGRAYLEKNIDEALEDNRGTTMSYAFQKARGDGFVGTIDPRLLKDGVEKTFNALGRDWKALMKMFEGTFNPRAIADAIDEDGHKQHLVLMRPDDFHKFARGRDASVNDVYNEMVVGRSKEGSPLRGWTEEEFQTWKAEHAKDTEKLRGRIRDALETEKGLDDIPFLIMRDGEIVGHEGRHRMDVFKEKGLDKIPVIIKDWSWKSDSKPGVGGFLNEDGNAILRMERPLRQRGTLTSGVDPTVYMDAGKKAYQGWSKFMQGQKINMTEFISGLADESTGDFINRMTNPDVVRDDIGHRLGMSSATYRTINPLISNPDSWAHHVIHHFDTQVKKALRYEHRLNSRFQPYFDAFNAYYRHGKINRATNVEKFRPDLGIALEVERNPEAWGGGKGKWYPTEPELVHMGMKPEAAKIWRGVYDAFEQTFDVLEKTLQAAGIKTPMRVPGYLPHIFKGPWGVKVAHKLPNGEMEYVGELNFYTRAERNKAAEQLKQRFPDEIIEMGDPNPHGNQVHELLTGMYRASDMTGKAKGLTSLMQALYESSAKGIIGAALERNHPTKFGHLLERVASNDPLMQLTEKQMKQSLSEFQNAIEAVNAWSARVEFVTKVLFPLDQAGFLPEKSNLRTAARTYMEQYMKIPDNWGKSIDTWFKDVLIRNGRNPAAFHNLMEWINAGFAKWYLFGNIPFYTVNFLQSTVSLPTLFAKKAISDMAGERSGSIAKALADAKPFMNKNFWNMADGDPVFKWAVENGYTDPIFVERMDTAKNRDPVAQAIERRTRWNAFNVGYHYFKQNHPHEAALKMAGEFANETAVPYSHQAGAPAILNNLPIVGRPLAMFATYQQHTLGMLSQQMRLANQARKIKNPKMMLHSLEAMVGLQAMNMAMYGLGGAALIQNYNDIAMFLNNQLGMDLPTSETAGRNIDKALGTDGVVTYGLVSRAMGTDVSSSAQGVGVNLPMAGANAFGTLFQTLWLGGRWAVGKLGLSDRQVTKKEAWEVLKGMPPLPRGVAEWAVRGNLLDPQELVKDPLGGGMGTMAMRDPNLPGDPRKKEEALARIFGLTSIDERQFAASERISAGQEARIQKTVQNLAQRFREKGATDENIEQAVQLAEEIGQDPEALIKTMIRYWMMQELSPAERKILPNLSSPRGLGKIERYMDERSKEEPEGSLLRGSDGTDKNVTTPWNESTKYRAEAELITGGQTNRDMKQFIPEGQKNNILLNGTAIPSVKIAEYAGNNDNVRGMVMSESPADIIYKNRHAEPGLYTLDHEAEHLLQKRGLGTPSKVNSKFDELTKTDGSLRRELVRSLIDHAPYLQRKYGVDDAYFTKEMWDYQGSLAKNLLYEQFATLGAIENVHNVDLTQDPYLRQNVFNTAIKRQAFRAMVGLRQTRLDARDLPPYTLIKDR